MGKAARYALLLGLGYALATGSYIVVSSHLAASASGSVAELHRLETIKGALFTLVTATLVGLAAAVLFSRIERDGSELVKRERALLDNERRVFAGLIAASIAHDANNVLAQMMADVQLLERAQAPEERQRTFVALNGALARLSGLTGRLQAASKQITPGTKVRFSLAGHVERALETLRAHPKVRGCEVKLVRVGDPTVELEPLVIDQIIGNLVLNAADATGGRGRVEVKVGLAGRAWLEVHDDGPGVPAERRAGLFDALVSTKPDGNGLGLFSVKATAHAAGGAVSVGESPLGGALFRVELPFAPQA